MDIKDVSTEAVALPLLPQTVWDSIVQLIFDPILELIDALIYIKSISLVSQSLRRACKNAVLHLDASRSLDAHIAVLATLPVAIEYLDLDSYYNREYVLRSATFVEHSVLSLKHVSAAVRCTNTLKQFPLLEHITLHGQESFPQLYPAVLDNNLKNLKHLNLLNYEHKVLTAEVPLSVLTRLESLTLRPRPDGRNFLFHTQDLPLKLKRLHLDGSFGSLQATRFAPHPEFSFSLLLTAAEEIVVEAEAVVLRHSMNVSENSTNALNYTDIHWLVHKLLHSPATLKR
jgi:hypothetical protein